MTEQQNRQKRKKKKKEEKSRVTSLTLKLIPAEACKATTKITLNVLNI